MVASGHHPRSAGYVLRYISQGYHALRSTYRHARRVYSPMAHLHTTWLVSDTLYDVLRDDNQTYSPDSTRVYRLVLLRLRPYAPARGSEVSPPTKIALAARARS